MLLSFQLQIVSPEALYALCIALVLVLVVFLLWPRRPNITRNNIRVTKSEGASVSVDQSRHVDVKVDAKITVSQHAPSPQPPKPSRKPSPVTGGRSSQDDAGAIFVAAVGVLAVVGFYYVRHFELITVISRTLCFAATAYGLFAFALDVHWRGPRFDGIKAGYLLAGIAGLVSAAFLLQAQALISSDVVQAAAATGRGAIDFVLNRLTQVGRMYLLASLLTTTVACFVAVMSLLAILRALLQSWAEPDDRSRFASLVLGATDWVAPIPFALLATPSHAFVAFMLYVWLPGALSVQR